MSQQASPAQLAAAITGAARTAGAGAPAVRGADVQTAVVTAVNTTAGTVDIGTIRARRLDSYLNPVVGDKILLVRSGNGNWYAAGRTATAQDGAWVSYTPVWTAATTNPVLGNGTLVGRYQRLGRTIVCHINLIPGSTTTFGSGNYSLTIPFTAANQGCTYIGHAHLLAGTRWQGQFVISPGATLGGPYMTTATGNASLTAMTPSAPSAFASTHQLRITATYEAAT